MLGRHADAFFRKHFNERVLAGTPNCEAGTIAYPDREAPGTHQITHVAGQYEMPGPQNVVDGNSMMPGMGATDMLPGMGSPDMLPGMGAADMLPGMGALNTGTMIKYGALAVGGYLAYKMFLAKKTSGGSRRRARRKTRNRRRARDSYGRFVAARG